MRRRDHDASALPVLLIAALLAAVYSVTNIAGPLAAYLVRWLLVLGMVTWLPIGVGNLAFIATHATRPRRTHLHSWSLPVRRLVLPTAASVDDALRDRAPWCAGLVEQRLIGATPSPIYAARESAGRS